jgi:putative solute:sodium symporter small subunit
MPHSPDERDPRVAAAIGRYWKKNVAIMAVLLIIWAAAGLGAGVLFADTLNAYSLGGYPLGFWFAQQGSIIVFVVLILVYAVVLNRLDRAHHRDLEAMGVVSRDGEGAA